MLLAFLSANITTRRRANAMASRRHGLKTTAEVVIFGHVATLELLTAHGVSRLDCTARPRRTYGRQQV